MVCLSSKLNVSVFYSICLIIANFGHDDLPLKIGDPNSVRRSYSKSLNSGDFKEQQSRPLPIEFSQNPQTPLRNKRLILYLRNLLKGVFYYFLVLKRYICYNKYINKVSHQPIKRLIHKSSRLPINKKPTYKYYT